MPNVGTIINSHNKKLIKDNAENFKAKEEKKCSCPKKVKCPLEDECFPAKLFTKRRSRAEQVSQHALA